ncbi:hypothetical protein CRENBAI_000801, partial [Crenichthys baileyi]
PPCHDLHFGPATKAATLTVGTSQKKDQAAAEEMITLSEYLRRAAEKSSGQAREKEEQRSPFWGLRLAIAPPGTGPRRHTLCAAEKGFTQARREEEQRSPFWGTRPAIPLPAPSSSSEPVLSAAHFLCPVPDSSTPPPQSPCPPSDSELLVCSSSRRRRLRRQDTVPPVVEIQTGASISFPEGMANTPSCMVSSTLLPGSQPCSSDHSSPSGGSRRKNIALPGSSLQSEAAENFTSQSQSHPSTPAWVLSGLAAVQAALVPVPDVSEGSANAPAPVSIEVQLDHPAPVFAGGQPEAPAPVSTGGRPNTSVPASVPPLLPVQPPTSHPASAISEGSADTPASVSGV